MTNKNNLNLISNTCIGARLYSNVLKKEFQNPFMWNLIKLSDFIHIVEYYDDIDFSDITEMFTNNEVVKEHDSDKCATIVLKHMGEKIYFIHHHYRENTDVKKILRQSGYDYEIIGEDILQYLHNKWIKRLGKNKEKPIFIYYDNEILTDCDIRKIFNLNTQYHIIVISPEDLKKYETDKIHYIKKETGNTITLAETVFNYIKKKIG